MPKISVVTNITTSNTARHLCHKQCKYLIPLDAPIAGFIFSCRLFNFDLVETNKKGQPIRIKECLSAEEKYVKLYHKSGKLDLGTVE